jgi:hypothetical protein
MRRPRFPIESGPAIPIATDGGNAPRRAASSVSLQKSVIYRTLLAAPAGARL